MQQQSGGGRKKALLVGINYIGTERELKGCINDVNNLFYFVTSRFGFPRSSVLTLTDNPQHAQLALDPYQGQPGSDAEGSGSSSGSDNENDEDIDRRDRYNDYNRPQQQQQQQQQQGGKKPTALHQMMSYAQSGSFTGPYHPSRQTTTPQQYSGQLTSDHVLPTRQTMLNGIHWLVQDARPGDTLFFFYSGHGGQTRDTSGDESDGMDDTICPLDYQTAGTIIDDDLHRYLVASLPEGCRLIAVMDCCHSGSVLDLPFSIPAQQKRGTLQNMRGGLVTCLAGCLDNQQSADMSIGGHFTGALSYALISVMEGALTRGESVTYARLLQEIKRVLSEHPSKIPQTPVLSYNENTFDPNNVVFVL